VTLLAGVSKNNPDARKATTKSRMVSSTECEACKDKCQKGISYLELFHKRGEGRGVMCSK